ncbi:MAG: hypothetical protein ACREJC_10205 [Tepidisphaeraceae bacterium]
MRENQNKYVWVIYFVGHDDTGSNEDAKVDALVGAEKIETSDDPQQVWEDASMAALLRGGEVLSVLNGEDDEAAEAAVHHFERQVLRLR